MSRQTNWRRKHRTRLSSRVGADRYDGTGRLVQEKVSGPNAAESRTTDYGYDKASNRTLKTTLNAAGTATVRFA